MAGGRRSRPDLGVVDGPDELQFASVVGVVRLADGRIAVGDRRAPGGAVRIFGPDGRFRGAFGPEGEGPGEIAALGSLFRYRGDSLAVWDGRLNRLSVFDDEGRLGRTMRMEIPMELHEGAGELMLASAGAVRGAFADGALYVRGGAWFHPAYGETFRMELVHFRASAEGEPLEPLGTFTAGEENVPAAAQPNAPYLRRFPTVHGAMHLYVGTGDAYEIRVVRLDGSLERIIRASHRDLAMTDEAREAYQEAQRARATDPDALEELERSLSSVRFPETIPPYDELRADAEGHLWVRDVALPGRDGPQRWSVFDPAGRLLGSVVTPERFVIHEIGADFVLGVWSDEFDVPHVRVYALERE